MALVFKDRVKVTSTTAGTGTLTLGSAASGFQDFSVIGNGNTTYYTITDQSGNWEVGVGTYTSSGTTLSRDTILESSNGGTAVDFPAGTKTVFVTYPAEKSVIQDASGNVTLQGVLTPSGGISNGATFNKTGSGGEGGELHLEKGATSTLSGDVVIDAYNQSVRIFENGGTNRGAQLDVSSQAAGVGSTILTTASTVSIANGGTGQTTATAAFNALSPITTAGDLILGNGTNSATRLAIGSSNQVLTSNGTTASWQTPSSGGTIGNLQYFSGETTTTYPGSSWLKCDGSVLTQTAYASLYSTIGLIPNNQPTTWTARESNTTSILNALCYGNGLFLYGGNFGALGTSTDGITWDAQTAATGSNIYGVAYGNNVYAYGGTGGALGYSSDGVTWTATSVTGSPNINGLFYGNGLFVYVGSSGAIGTSTNAITWTTRTSGTTSALYGITYGNGLYVASGNSGFLATSTNAITWTTRTTGTGSDLFAVNYRNGLYVAAGQLGALITSTDAITWTTRTSGTVNHIRALTSTKAGYVYAGLSGTVASSSDGVSWTIRTSGTSSALYGLSNGNGVYAYAGAGGVIRTATLYTYNTASEFVLPKQLVYVDSNYSQLYIKATS